MIRIATMPSSASFMSMSSTSSLLPSLSTSTTYQERSKQQEDFVPSVDAPKLVSSRPWLTDTKQWQSNSKSKSKKSVRTNTRIPNDPNSDDSNQSQDQIEQLEQAPSEDSAPSVENTMTDIQRQLQQFNPSNAPVIPNQTERRGEPGIVQVHLIVDLTSESGVVDPSSKFLLEAVERSTYLQSVGLTFIRELPPIRTVEMHPRDPQLPFLFLIDWGSMNRDCHRLQLVMETVQQQYVESDTNRDSHGVATNTTTGARPQQRHEPYVLLVDFTGSIRRTECDYLFQEFAREKNKVRLAKRSIVQDRFYEHSTKRIHPGKLIPNQWHEPSFASGPILHSPLVLRETIVTIINNITQGKSIQSMERPIDVGYFWTSGDYSHFSFYRRDIAKVVKTLHHSKIDDTSVMENQVRLAYSDKKGMGEGNVQEEYFSELLTCKIVVITQHDEFEDHYRLMESLASGALVMTDPMIAMPAGLVDKVNVVVYNSPSDLKKLIKYYLQPENEKERKRIAEEGFKLVMGRHRCWHRLEELVFGRPLTNVDKPFLPAPPKEERPKSLFLVAVEEIVGQFV